MNRARLAPKPRSLSLHRSLLRRCRLRRRLMPRESRGESVVVFVGARGGGAEAEVVTIPMSGRM